jgi:uncharacterized protein (PEP-CTERM system associated)
MPHKRKPIAIPLLACAPLITLFYSPYTAANELTWTAGVGTEAVYQEVYSEEAKSTRSSKNLIVRPQLSLNYTSKRTNAFWQATHNHVRRSFDDVDITNNYTNYAYGANVTAIENLLSFTASGALNYRTTATNGYFVDDFLLNSENLSKTRSNRFGANFTLPRGDYFGHTTQLSYSITESEKREDSRNQLNSDVISVTTQTYTGNDFERLYAQVDTSFSISERSVNGDYMNRSASGNLSYRLISNFGLTVVASHEANQVKSSDNIFSNSRQFNTVGAGIIWRETDNKRIALTWNRADNDSIEQDEDNEGYIGLDLNWQFTPRTQVSGAYTRRFFGESGNFSFQHRIRKLRTQITYNEEVTSFSRLIAEPSNLGVFVCIDGIIDIASCFQPNSLSYQLQPNEQFIQFNSQNSEINDELILRKGLSWELGTELRRTKVALNGRYSTNEYLESNRTSRTYSVGTSIAFDIGRKTNLSWTANAAHTDNILEGERGESDVLTTKISLSRPIGRFFDLSLDLSYLQRESEGTTFNNETSLGFTGDIKDRRISLNLQYKFSK